METRMAQVIDRLVELAAALPGHRRNADQTVIPELTTVFDGPEIRATDDHSPGSLLVIGWPGESPEELVPSGSTSFRRGPIAGTNRPRDETGSVTCRAIAQNLATPKEARDAALAEITAVAAICRADPSLGLNTSDTIGGVRTIAFVTAGDLLQYLDDGNVCEWEFSVTYDTRV